VRLNRCGWWRAGRVWMASSVLAALATGALLLSHGGVGVPAVAKLLPLARLSPAQAPPGGKASSTFAALPLIFEPNQGQSDPRVKFLARGSGYGLFLTPDEAVLELQSFARHQRKVEVLRMSPAGAQPAASLSGEDRLPGHSNYFIGNDPAKWRRNIPQFARVRYSQVYPGIDLAYYGNAGRLEYDFVIAPGADPAQIKLHFEGTANPRLDAQGNLLLPAADAKVRFEAPRVYQLVGGERQPVAGRFALLSSHEVGFELGAYDRSRALVIDPVLSYSTFIGGSGDEGCSAITGTPASGCPALAIDPGSDIYLAGPTTSSDFPVPSGDTPPLLKGAANVFVIKLINGGSAVGFTTYLGGSGVDTTAGIGVDTGFDVFVAGTTNSPDFPSFNGLTYSSLSAGNHAFVSELDPTGSTILYSTYLAGSGNETASGFTLDNKGKAYVIGVTTSSDYPVTPAAFQSTSRATNQFFLTRIDTALPGSSSLAYSTYFGGGFPSNGLAVGGGVAVDSTGDVYITGGTNFQHIGCDPTSTSCLDFPLLDSYQGCLDSAPDTSPCPTNLTALDVFVAKLNPALAPAAQLLYSTYLGGSGDDIGYGVAVDSGGSAYVTGSTNSTDFSFTPASGTAVFQNCLDDPTNPATCPAGATATDAFLAKLGIACVGTTCTTTTVPLNYFTYLGGSGNDVGLAITLDTGASTGGAYITGWTNSADFHTQNPIQAGTGGGTDAFVTRIATSAVTATDSGHSSSYLGGAGSDRGTSVAVNAQGNIFVAGETSSNNFPIISPLTGHGLLDGPSDAFIARLGPAVNLSMSATVSANPVGIGNQVTFTYTITNNGDLNNGITFVDNLPPSLTATATASASGGCGSEVNFTITCSLGTVSSGAKPTVTVTVTPTVAGNLGNSASVSVNGSNTPAATASISTVVNDFGISVDPPTATEPAGTPASYKVTVTPTGPIPDNVSLSCGSGLPTGATCAFSTTPFPNLANGPASSMLVINTTERVTTTVRLWHGGAPFYAFWLPVSGLALAGMGGKNSRLRKILLAVLAAAFLGLVMLQAGCGSSGTTTNTTGTPAGTYTITVNGVCGTVTHTTTVQLTVQ